MTPTERLALANRIAVNKADPAFEGVRHVCDKLERIREHAGILVERRAKLKQQLADAEAEGERLRAQADVCIDMVAEHLARAATVVVPKVVINDDADAV